MYAMGRGRSLVYAEKWQEADGRIFVPDASNQPRYVALLYALAAITLLAMWYLLLSASSPENEGPIIGAAHTLSYLMSAESPARWHFTVFAVLPVALLLLAATAMTKWGRLKRGRGVVLMLGAAIGVLTLLYALPAIPIVLIAIFYSYKSFRAAESQRANGP